MYLEYVISFVLAFIIAFSSTPIAKTIAFKVGAVDIPKDDRRMHKRPIARMGGLAIIAGFFVSFFFSIAGTSIDLRSMGFDTKMLFFVLGLTVIALTGIIDDARNLRPYLKLLLQVLAASLVVFGGEIVVKSITNPFSETGFYDFNIYVSYLVSILWIIGITNAINLIDGLDGLAAGVTAISSFSLFCIAILNKDYLSALVTAIIAGTSLGFLPYNFNPAKIFMGDTGSMFLGFSLSVITIQGTLKSYAAISILAPLIILGLPLLDTSFAIIRRLFSGKPIMTADRGHLHHRLIDMGLTQRQSVLVLYMACATLGLGAIVLAFKGFVTAISMVLSVFVFLIIGARSLIDFDGGEEYSGEKINELNEMTLPRPLSRKQAAGAEKNEGISLNYPQSKEEEKKGHPMRK